MMNRDVVILLNSAVSLSVKSMIVWHDWWKGDCGWETATWIVGIFCSTLFNFEACLVSVACFSQLELYDE
ncbi:hypothetical protein I7I48_05793 [Histoplasma ohiense]|nr:hypothetical protein I7I48_05793 [Histoplasma ohiense (nom. inval.)]